MAGSRDDVRAPVRASQKATRMMMTQLELAEDVPKTRGSVGKPIGCLQKV